LRYAPDSPPEITVAHRDNSLALIVADRGPGIPEASREKIFQPLVRLDLSRTIDRAPEGFGLGLAIARSAMRTMGGDLACRPRADGQGGAEFIFTFRALETSNLQLSGV
jgi:signal transduction histidine kinase